ncbi:hypothetical protein [Sphaerisporangium siamense]|uniref:Uncharacterized protein n=1 Tax=Sphaerisporangium siamense TaxID=795645 RepID=A0A7W7DAT2_9ACTN|nr:hypothetical protein [Sphaerisporangium siamense]MBB4703423.1 hypothetical protein [Sphaerisporangium siamense]
MSVPETAPVAAGAPHAPGRHGSPGARRPAAARGRVRNAGTAGEIGEGH